MKRTIITHPEMGIFIGAAAGLAFWSMLDAAGQSEVVTFEDEADARDFVGSWVPPQNPDQYSYVEVESVREWATVAELDRVGLGDFTALLLFNVAPLGSPC